MSSKSFLKQIQLITFDVHNVLLTIRNGAPYHYARLAREHLGVQSLDESVLRSNFAHVFQTLNQLHPGYGVHTGITSRQWWTFLIEYTFKDYNISADQLERLSKIIYDEFSGGKLWIKHPQADQVLKELQTKKLLGVISNFDERLERILEEQQLRQYFQFILTPRNCGLYKPQKEIFTHAANLANIESNHNLCHVGDDVKLDYQAAKTANCQALLLTKNEESKQSLLNKHKDIDENDVILNLSELVDEIKKLI
jgi:REG-2-like HAD superfamily hydrolase